MTMPLLAEEYIEVLGVSTPQVQNANQYVEVLVVPVKPEARNGELYVEVLVVRPPDATPFIGWGMPL